MIYSHGGDFGDTIYHLPIVRAKGGGELVLYPMRGTSHGMSEPRAALIAPLIEAQPYISKVRWSPTGEGVILDVWRQHYKNYLNLTDMACEAFGLPHPPREQPWLFARPNRTARVVFHRSARYRNTRFPWKRVYEKYRREAVFVGLPDEHADFCRNVGPVSYAYTENLLQLAEVVQGCELYVGNQSAPFAVAEGLKVPTILEIGPINNCHWERVGNIHGWGENVRLPEIDELPGRLARSVAARGNGRTPIAARQLAALARAVRDAAALPGDLAEVGGGGSGFAKVLAGADPAKTLHRFGPHGEDDAREFLAGYRVVYHARPFAEATSGDAPRFSFVHVAAGADAGAAREYFWPRLVEGGVLVIDESGKLEDGRTDVIDGLVWVRKR
ncbi:glycosyltransferase family protein [Limnoglobus roseus]|nr:hypothetical protein [Limnoglobus roseus]